MKRWRVSEDAVSLLRMAREITGFPVAWIGEIVGMPRSTVSSIVNGYAHEWLDDRQVAQLLGAVRAYRDLTIEGVEEMEKLAARRGENIQRS